MSNIWVSDKNFTCNLVATSNTALTGFYTLDGVVITDGMFILAASQTDSTASGPYIARSGSWDRIISLATGQQFYIAAGTSGATDIYELQTVVPIIVGTTPLTFATSTPGAPTGPAGGVLSGTYPNPGLATSVSAKLPPTPTAAGKVIIDTGTSIGETAAGTMGQVLTSQGAATPTWTTITSGPTLPLSKANGGFGVDVSTGLTNDQVAIVAGGAITIGALTTTAIPSGIDAAKIGAGTVSNTQFGYVDATSSIQTQLDSKQATLTLPLSIANGGTASTTGDLVATNSLTTPSLTAASTLAITSAAGATTLAGSTLTVTAGQGGPTSGAGGAITVSGGAAQGSSGAGGASTVQGGAGIGGSTGGAFTGKAGQGGATGAGGVAAIIGGAGGATSGAGGAASLTGGAGTASNSAGGAVTIKGGLGVGSSTGGNATLSGGNGGSTGTGGSITISGGTSGGGNAAGGGVSITGTAAFGSGAAGSISITAGSAGTTGNPGTISISSGSSGTTSGNGGLTTVKTANAGTGSNGDGGRLDLKTGNGDGSGYGGLINIISGNGGSTGGANGITVLCGNAGVGSGLAGGTIAIDGGVGDGAGGNGPINIGRTNASTINMGIAGGTINMGRGNVTQASTISTGVTINACSGKITTVSTTLAATSQASFTVTNSCIIGAPVIILSLASYSGTYQTNGIPIVSLSTISTGSFVILITNIHATNALNGTLQINYAIL